MSRRCKTAYGEGGSCRISSCKFPFFSPLRHPLLSLRSLSRFLFPRLSGRLALLAMACTRNWRRSSTADQLAA